MLTNEIGKAAAPITWSCIQHHVYCKECISTFFRCTAQPFHCPSCKADNKRANALLSSDKWEEFRRRGLLTQDRMEEKRATVQLDALAAFKKELTDEGISYKECPTCGVPCTHFAAHGCHHVKCTYCQTEWCYRCEALHPCGCKQIFCDRLRTCGCPLCPTCDLKKGPCRDCNRDTGACWSCRPPPKEPPSRMLLFICATAASFAAMVGISIVDKTNSLTKQDAVVSVSRSIECDSRNKVTLIDYYSS